MKRIVLIVLVAGFLFVGCDNGNGTGGDGDIPTTLNGTTWRYNGPEANMTVIFKETTFKLTGTVTSNPNFDGVDGTYSIPSVGNIIFNFGIVGEDFPGTYNATILYIPVDGSPEDPTLAPFDKVINP